MIHLLGLLATVAFLVLVGWALWSLGVAGWEDSKRSMG